LRSSGCRAVNCLGAGAGQGGKGQVERRVLWRRRGRGQPHLHALPQLVLEHAHRCLASHKHQRLQAGREVGAQVSSRPLHNVSLPAHHSGLQALLPMPRVGPNATCMKAHGPVRMPGPQAPLLKLPQAHPGCQAPGNCTTSKPQGPTCRASRAWNARRRVSPTSRPLLATTKKCSRCAGITRCRCSMACSCSYAPGPRVPSGASAGPRVPEASLKGPLTRLAAAADCASEAACSAVGGSPADGPRPADAGGCCSRTAPPSTRLADTMRGSGSQPNARRRCNLRTRRGRVVSFCVGGAAACACVRAGVGLSVLQPGMCMVPRAASSLVLSAQPAGCVDDRGKRHSPGILECGRHRNRLAPGPGTQAPPPVGHGLCQRVRAWGCGWRGRVLCCDWWRGRVWGCGWRAVLLPALPGVQARQRQGGTRQLSNVLQPQQQQQQPRSGAAFGGWVRACRGRRLQQQVHPAPVVYDARAGCHCRRGASR